MNLKSFLKNYKVNLEYFDLDAFEDEIMDIPYQIKVLKDNLNKLDENDKKMFFHLNNKLKEKLNEFKPKNDLQNKIIFEIKNIL